MARAAKSSALPMAQSGPAAAFALPGAEGILVPRGERPGGSGLCTHPQPLTRLIFISLRSRRANWVLSRCSTVRPCRRAAHRCELLGFLLLCFSAMMRCARSAAVLLLGDRVPTWALSPVAVGLVPLLPSPALGATWSNRGGLGTPPCKGGTTLGQKTGLGLGTPSPRAPCTRC